MDDERGGEHRASPSTAARLGVVVLLATALCAGVAAVGGQVLLAGDGVRSAGFLPSAAQVRQSPFPARVAPADADGGSRPGEPTSTSPARPIPGSGAGAPSSDRIAAGQRLLERQAAAVADRDRAAYLATVDPRDASAREVAARTFDNYRRLDVVGYGFGALSTDGAALDSGRRDQLGPTAWAADVEVTFRLAGEDTEPWSTSLRVAFVERAGELYVTGASGSGRHRDARPLWLQDSVEVVHGRHSIVIGTGSRERLAAYARATDAGIPRIDELWQREWSHHVVVVVPKTQAQMERMIGAEPGSQSQVAAVTTSVGRSRSEVASHIVVNPATFATIGALSRQVVLTHEAVHVATQATVSRVPAWLSEGFADYVGFAESGLPAKTVAQRFLSHVREHGAPVHLPDAADFDPLTNGLDRSYEASWLACRYLVRTWGEDALVEFYEGMDAATSAGEDHDVYREVLGSTPESFVAGWRDYVEAVAQR